MEGPIFLSLNHVLRLHARQIERYGGSEGIRDTTLIESAIAQPQQSFGGEYLHNNIPAMAGDNRASLFRCPYSEQITRCRYNRCMDPRQLFTGFLSRHLISITYFDPSKNDIEDRSIENAGVGRYTMLTGFLISVRGRWLIMTAGHIIHDLDKALSDGQLLYNFRLDDTFGLYAKYTDPIPFDYVNSRRHHVYDKDGGCDYGFIILSEHDRTLLSENGVEAMGEEIWEQAWPETFQNYWLVGIPEELVDTKPVGAGKVEINGKVARLAVKKIDDPPEKLRKPFERFYGRIGLPNGPGNLTDIDGMSGGPIFGFNHNDKGEPEYFLYAVQSGWDSETKTIAACFIQPLIKDLAAQIDEHRRKHGSN